MSTTKESIKFGTVVCTLMSGVITVDYDNGYSYTIDLKEVYAIESLPNGTILYSTNKGSAKGFKDKALELDDYIKLKNFIQKAFITTCGLTKTTL